MRKRSSGKMILAKRSIFWTVLVILLLGTLASVTVLNLATFYGESTTERKNRK